MTTSHLPVDPQSGFINKLLVGAIFLCLIMEFFMAFRFEINQDEFYNLSMGYEFTRGEIGNPFQTLFFRFSGWLGLIPGNEIDQIVMGRSITYLAGIMTCFFIYKTSRRYFSTPASLFAVLAFFGINFVFRHLTAFRTDILSTMVLMCLLWLVSNPKQSFGKVIVSGLLIGIAFSLALKSIFYMPVVAIFLLGRWAASNWSRDAFLHGLVMFVVAILTYSVIFVLHDPATYSSQDNATYLKTISNSSLGENGLFNRWGLTVISMRENPFVWALIFFGFTEVRSEIKNNQSRPKHETVGLLAFLIPLTPTVFYFHANVYFYPFMLAPAIIFVAAAADRFLINKKGPIFGVLICIFCLFPIVNFIRNMSLDQQTQRNVLDAVHEIFPSPVPVIDFCGMVSSFDRVNEAGLFINPDVFGHSSYLDADKPIMKDIIKNYKPLILLANATGLDLKNEYKHEHPYPLLQEDTEVVNKNYVKFWGPIYIPGQRLNQDGVFEILIGGTYTYYGDANAIIDGKLLKNNQVLNLTQGAHTISGLSTKQGKLVWGYKLKKPNLPEPTQPLFNGF